MDPRTLKAKRRELRAELKRLRELPRSPKVATERATAAEALRENDSEILINKAAEWGIDAPKYPDAFSHETSSRGYTIVTTYLNDSATAMLTYKIREARLTYWKHCAEILAPIVSILSLLVAILALLRT